ncbi:hypothetical protein FEM48_Zijuj03G0030300 [Ziziphus jujuba var. spinosa]|uniref:Uncharacterized protein n=1 Tax=Ziziphus jujuba var. spinosa TaxID=714518 RepID=A0A978VMS8_ZIZJJ|nr:hypothetical protein FEM48_Zijuj03G0030300 [Ziziphus jujuba var. spinosa]
MGGGQVCPVDHFIPNEGDRSDPSGDWVTFVRLSSLRSISGRPLRSIFNLASPSPSKHLWPLDFGGLNYPSKHLWLVSLSSAASFFCFVDLPSSPSFIQRVNYYVGQISARLSFGNSDAISRMWENWICIWIWTWLHDFAGRCKVDILISI